MYVFAGGRTILHQQQIVKLSGENVPSFVISK
jgi:hypothetical protein